MVTLAGTQFRPPAKWGVRSPRGVAPRLAFNGGSVPQLAESDNDDDVPVLDDERTRYRRIMLSCSLDPVLVDCYRSLDRSNAPRYFGSRDARSSMPNAPSPGLLKTEGSLRSLVRLSL